MKLRAALAVYNSLLALLLLLGWPLLALLMLRSRKLRGGFLERLTPLPRRAHPCVWVHAASVGEVEAAVPLVRALRTRGTPLLLTTQTLTGRERLRAHFPELEPRLAPLDLPALTGLSVRRAQTRALVLIETEIWPNWIRAVQCSGGVVLIASARLSDSGFASYARVRAWLAPLLACIDAVAARSGLDRDRFVALGVPAANTLIAGDLKLDAPSAPAASDALREAIGASPFLLAASTHVGEDEPVLEAWRKLRASVAPSLRLVLVPRHPERARDVHALALRFGSAELRSCGGGEAEIVVVDTVGELRSLYALADLVVMGGTFAPIGGHNLLEPISAGRVVVLGPHAQNQREQVELLAPLGVLHRVSGAAELAPALAALWTAPDRDVRAHAARGVLEVSRGACDRIVARLDALLGR